MEILIIGAGPAGLMAAIQAADKLHKVTILERNDRIGKKLLVTGNGKCNLTNMDQEPCHYHNSDPGFTRAVLNSFSREETCAFFEHLGLCFKNRNGWLYPYCEQAQAVAKLLEQEARRKKVRIKTNEHVLSVQKKPKGFEVQTETWSYRADRVILCSGSPASMVEGASDEGMRMAESLSHTLVEPLPALVPLKGKGNAYGKWAGVRMDCRATLVIDGKQLRQERGEVQFTDYGISGIAVFQLSTEAVRSAAEGKKVTVFLDLMPDYTKGALKEYLERQAERDPGAPDPELFTGLLPDKMIRMIAGKQKKTPEEYASLLKAYPVPVKGAHSLARAQVCSGGIALHEVDPSTMESKRVPGLYFAGEILETSGDCGGYNLQWAWSTGAIAGRSAGNKQTFRENCHDTTLPG